MGLELKANTAVDVLIGPFVDSTDGDTAETGLTLSQADIKLSKNGQTLAQKNDATAASHDSDGYYNCELDATDTNTEGQLVLIVHETGALPVRHEFNVLSEAAWDSKYAPKDSGYMDVDVKAISTSTTAADNAETVFDTDFATNYNATRNAWVTNAQDFVGTTAADPFNGQVVSASVTGAVGSVTAGVSLANGAITDASLAGNMEIVFETDFATNYNTTRNAWATNVQDTVGSGNLPANAVQIEGSDATDQINAACDTAIETYGLDHLVGASVTGTDVVDNSIIAKMVSSGATADWDTFVNTTDSLQAIRDRGDAAWVTGSGGSDRLLMVDTTIATLSSQTSFTLTDGSTDDGAYNNCTIVIEDASTSTQKAVGLVSDYTGSTKTITLKYDPGIFTMATSDKVYILAENSLKTTAQNRQLNVAADGDLVEVNTLTGHTVQTADHTANISAILTDTSTTLDDHLTDIKGTGFVKDTHSLVDIEGYADLIDDGTSGLAKIATDVAAVLVDTNSLNDTKIPQTLNLTASGNIGIDWANIENPTTAVDLSGTDIQLCDTVTTNSDMRGTDSAFLAASAPANFSSLVISGSGAADCLVQGFLNNTIAETTADNIAANFETFYDNADALTSQTVDDVGGGGGGGGDATEANQTTIITHLTDIKGTGFVKDTNSLVNLTPGSAVNLAVTVDSFSVETN